MEDMIQNHRNRNTILKNSLSIFFILLVTSCNFLHRAKMEKMQGLWILNKDESIINRESTIRLGNTIFINQDSIRLPSVFVGKIFGENSMSEIEKTNKIIDHNRKRENNRRGYFYFIDSNADSVVFEAPNNPLVGKYRIQIIQDGQYRYMILSNDSTYLVCSQNTFYLW